MKKLFIILLLLQSCASTNQTKEEPTKPNINPTSTVNFVHITKLSNFTEKEKEKVATYIPVMNNTLASKCFADTMKVRGLLKTNDKTPEEVVAHIRRSTIDIELVMYYKRFSKVHGYTYPNVDKIYLNRKYHSGASLCSEASNLAHELSHKIGYGHDYKATKYRPFSVPYSINAAFKACCK